MTYAIGIDLGATNFRVGVVSDEGEIAEMHIDNVGPNRKPEAVAHFLGEVVSKLRKHYKIDGAGAGIPGIVDIGRGVVYQSPHYPDWDNVDFKTILSQALGTKVVVDNDANMIALGEGWLGAGRGLKNFIMVTLGTGIGGGIICDGKLWHGNCGFAGEIGHSVLEFNGPHCSCGSRGCFEMYASATGLKHIVEISDDPHKKAFMKKVDDNPEKVTPEILFDLARDGDMFSSLIWKEFGKYLGAGLASAVNTTGILDLIIGGGLSRAWDFFIQDARREFSRRTYRKVAHEARLTKAELVDSAGILGSAKFLFNSI